MVDGSGLWHATLLIQIFLATFTAQSLLPRFGSESEALKKVLGTLVNVCFGGMLRVFVPFAMLTALGGVSGFLTNSGLWLCLVSILLDVAMAGSVAFLTGKDGSGEASPFEDEKMAKIWKFARLGKDGSSLIGMLLLVLSGLPGGLSFVCASILLRVAFIQKLALLLPDMVPALVKLQPVGVLLESLTSHVPALVTFMVVDQVLWGSSSFLGALVNPSLYVMLGFVGLTVVVVATPLALNGVVKQIDLPFQVDVEVSNVDIGAKLSLATKILPMVLYGALLMGFLKSHLGIFAFSANIQGFSLSWGEPVLAGAVLMINWQMLFCHCLCGAGFGVSRLTGLTGFEVPALTEVADAVKPIFVLCPMIALVAIAIHVDLPQGRGLFLWLLTAPTTYGILLFGVALMLQLLLAITGQKVEFDQMGTPTWTGESLNEQAVWVARSLRLIRLFRLSGFVLGFMGLGIIIWLLAGAIVAGKFHKELLMGVDKLKPMIAETKVKIEAFIAEKRGQPYPPPAAKAGAGNPAKKK